MMGKSDHMLAQIATLGPIGRLPAPGTMGSLAAIIIGVVITIYGGIGSLVIAMIIAVVVGLPAADAHFRITGIKDSGAVVIDEVAGQWLALLAIPYTAGANQAYITAVIMAFLLFRFFDIVKMGPVKMTEDLPGGIGVMADDIVAGILAGGVIILAAAGFKYL